MGSVQPPSVYSKPARRAVEKPPGMPLMGADIETLEEHLDHLRDEVRDLSARTSITFWRGLAVIAVTFVTSVGALGVWVGSVVADVQRNAELRQPVQTHEIQLSRMEDALPRIERQLGDLSSRIEILMRDPYKRPSSR